MIITRVFHWKGSPNHILTRKAKDHTLSQILIKAFYYFLSILPTQNRVHMVGMFTHAKFQPGIL